MEIVKRGNLIAGFPFFTILTSLKKLNVAEFPLCPSCRDLMAPTKRGISKRRETGYTMILELVLSIANWPSYF
ncbi:hypothetical protein D3C77_341450 [compost metagenome]